ncbi:hypothetical protein ACQ4PT_066894 [Festuca glaucescens]
MGKYMRKAKVSGEVAVMEVTAAPLGVRTRARALAMQRQPLEQGDYLELRSRKLEKLLPPPPQREPAARRKGAAASELAAAERAEAEADEVSFGENVLELEPVERGTRETTPCSVIRSSETISTPGSTTRPSHSSSHRRVQAPVRHNIPSSAEMNDFFSAAEQPQLQAFIDKYNFDPVNDCPLPGRYEWVKLD